MLWTLWSLVHPELATSVMRSGHLRLRHAKTTNRLSAHAAHPVSSLQMPCWAFGIITRQLDNEWNCPPPLYHDYINHLINHHIILPNHYNHCISLQTSSQTTLIFWVAGEPVCWTHVAIGHSRQAHDLLFDGMFQCRNNTTAYQRWRPRCAQRLTGPKLLLVGHGWTKQMHSACRHIGSYNAVWCCRWWYSTLQPYMFNRSSCLSNNLLSILYTGIHMFKI